MVAQESGDESTKGLAGIDFENGSNCGTDLIQVMENIEEEGNDNNK